jgi:hypothetical protein
MPNALTGGLLLRDSDSKSSAFPVLHEGQKGHQLSVLRANSLCIGDAAFAGERARIRQGRLAAGKAADRCALSG